MASTYLSRTITPSTINKKKFTFSAWVKIDNLTADGDILSFNGSTDYTVLRIKNADRIDFLTYDGGVQARRVSAAKYRDCSGFYHVVLSVNSDDTTADDRIKIYVNGERLTAFDSSVNPSSGFEFINNNKVNLNIGSNVDQTPTRWYFGGIMSHVHFIDGLTYDASAFGETDSATGQWKIKTSPSVTYGTNGFFILKDGNSVTDQSGNTNNFTVSGGTLTKTEDNPSNVFATYNPLGNFFPADTFSNGNTTQTTNAGNYTYNTSTLGASDGKYYCEIKNSTNNNNCMGIVDRPSTSTSDELTGTTYGWGYVTGGQIYSNGSIVATYNSVTTNDIIGIALDLDNNKVYFSKNGTWQGSSDPSAGTGGISITDPASNRTGFYFFASGDSATNSAVNQANFGNGFFGTTAVASAGTNASGNGIFEYDVPTGYTALSTKGLNL